jgi:hypothetical protein
MGGRLALEDAAQFGSSSRRERQHIDFLFY